MKITENNKNRNVKTHTLPRNRTLLVIPNGRDSPYLPPPPTPLFFCKLDNIIWRTELKGDIFPLIQNGDLIHCKATVKGRSRLSLR